MAIMPLRDNVAPTVSGQTTATDTVSRVRALVLPPPSAEGCSPPKISTAAYYAGTHLLDRKRITLSPESPGKRIKI